MLVRGMGRIGFTLALLILAACAGRKDDLNLIEREMYRFRAENEAIRAEDLQRAYLRQKRKADALSEDLLALTRHRDELYAKFDALRAETARMERDRKVAVARLGQLKAALGKARKESAQVQAQLEAEKKALAALRRELDKTRAERREAEAKRPAEKTPE